MEKIWVFIQAYSVIVVLLNVSDRKGSIYKRQWYHNNFFVGFAMIFVWINSVYTIAIHILK